MSNDGWWDRQLGRQAPPQQRQEQLPMPMWSPPNPNVPMHPQHQQPYPQGPPTPHGEPQFQSLSEALNAGYAGKGAEAARKELHSCPECGSNNYFSRSTGASRLPPPAPTCYECGYNGMFQQGDPAVWQAS